MCKPKKTRLINSVTLKLSHMEWKYKTNWEKIFIIFTTPSVRELLSECKPEKVKNPIFKES
jgi:hypothetical protein